MALRVFGNALGNSAVEALMAPTPALDSSTSKAISIALDPLAQPGTGSGQYGDLTKGLTLWSPDGSSGSTPDLTDSGGASGTSSSSGTDNTGSTSAPAVGGMASMPGGTLAALTVQSGLLGATPGSQMDAIPDMGTGTGEGLELESKEVSNPPSSNPEQQAQWDDWASSRYQDRASYFAGSEDLPPVPDTILRPNGGQPLGPSELTFDDSVEEVDGGGERKRVAGTSVAGSDALRDRDIARGLDWPVKGNIGPIDGYDESGVDLWRKRLDGLFCWAAEDHNSRNGLQPGEPMNLTPMLLKAQAMVESGGSKSAFLSDPMSSNHKGDWGDGWKAQFGLTKGQDMTPLTSVAAGIDILNYKAYFSNGTYKGMEMALRGYNGNTRIYSYHPGQEHRNYYAAKILALAGGY